MPMEVPSVSPSKTPDQISGTSGSSRWETILDCPGRRRRRSGNKSSTLSGKPGGQPSMMARYPGPWLTPAVVTRNNSPKEVPGMRVFYRIDEPLAASRSLDRREDSDLRRERDAA